MATPTTPPIESARLDAIREAIVDRGRGFAVVRRALSEAVLDAYLEESRRFLAFAPVIVKRIHRPDMYDYAHPRHVKEDGTVVRDPNPSTWRIYRFPHNRQSDNTRVVHDRIIGLRDEIERCWLSDDVYRRHMAEVHDYVQITRFTEDRLGLPKHSDYGGPPTLPFLQAFVFLSRPEEDFLGGELVLHPAEGPSQRLHGDLGAERGDIVYFDRSVIHEVEPTRAAPESTIGRWSLVVSRDRYGGEYLDRWLFRPFYLDHIRPRRRRLEKRLERWRRRLTGSGASDRRP